MPQFSSWAAQSPLSEADLKSFYSSLEIKRSEHLKQNSKIGIYNGKHAPLSKDNLLASVNGQCQWHDSELQRLSKEAGHETALIEAWRRYGTELLNHVIGPCSLVIANLETAELFVSTDRVGIHNLYYTTTPSNCILVADSINPVLSFPGVPQQLSAQSVYDYLYFHMIPGPNSIYDSISKLPPAHYLHVQNGKLDIRQYWVPEFTEKTALSRESMGGELKSLLGEIVSDRLTNAGTPNVGSFLSGGLDSSTVTGMMAQASPSTLSSYTIGFDAEGFDEVEYAKIASKHFGTNSKVYYLTPEDILDAVPRIAACYEEPFGNSSVIPTYYCAKFAKENGEKLLLAGDGGDELFAGNERYAKQQVFEIYHHLPGFARKMLQHSVSHESLTQKVLPLRKLQSYIEQASVPLPGRLQTYNYLYRHDPQEIFTRDFYSRVDSDYPNQLQNDWFHKPQSASALNKMLYLDWLITLGWNDLRKVTHACNYAGIDVEYPMLDERLIDFSCQIPSSWKLNKLRLRYFYKQSMQGFLPDAILNKSKHGFGLPFGIWATTHNGLRELIHDSVSDLKKRDIISKQFLDQALNMHEQTHAKYYGELLWVLMMLELWLSSHTANSNSF